MNRLVDSLFRPAIIALLLFLAGCASTKSALPVATAAPVRAAGTAVPATASADVLTHIQAGDAALKAGDLAGAVQAYQAGLAIDPKSADANFAIGNVYEQEGRLNDAQAAYQAALSSRPDMVGARSNLGVIYYQMGQFDKAVEQYNQVLHANPNDAETLYLLAAVRLQQKDYPQAEQLLLKARDNKPDLPEVYYGLGTLYELQGKKDQAIASFEKFLEIGPGQDPSAKTHAEEHLKGLKGQ
jgi:tetratricopeptide (TPR) repeat protein